MDLGTLAARIARTKALLNAAREAAAVVRNQRHIAILRRELDKLTRPTATPLLLRVPSGE